MASADIRSSDEGERLEAKRRRAEDILRSRGRVVVALSGGVDSAALLAVARDALGVRAVLAVTGRSDAVTESDVADASRVASQLGVEHVVVRTHEMDRPEYRANDGRRCFHCRMELFKILKEMACDRRFDAVAYGAIVDDLGDDRPGMEAAADLGILAPFLDAGIGKADTRGIARAAGLAVHEKPASPCLASRIPVGTEVTPERLDRVRRAEGGLRELGFVDFRVRHHGEIARLELGDADARRLDDPGARGEAVRRVQAAGYRYVVVDLQGLRRPRPLYRIGPKRDSGQ